MALLDLSKVTETLVTLLLEHIKNSQAWKPRPAPITLVVPDPPDKLTGDQLGVYLYHILEDPSNKNMHSPHEKPQHVRYVPMPLLLFYILNAHSDSESPTGTYTEQLLMGCALKALHEFPVIDDKTKVNGVPILKVAENCFQIELRPVPPEDAIHYWTAGGGALRLAAYYQVSIVMLEPEEPPSRAGRVLLYNVFAFPGEAPRLTSSSNTLTFTLPGENTVREITLRPAQVPFGDTLRLEGTNLADDRTVLLLNRAGWGNPIEVNQTWFPPGTPPVTRESVTAVVQNTAGAQTLVPGIYGALVRVIRSRSTPSGGTRRFEHLSNETPFAISPQISNIVVAPATGVVTISGRLFQDPEILPGALKVYIGETLLEEKATGTLSAGQYRVNSPVQITLELPSGLTSGEYVPFRLIINGAESSPKWIQVP
jgi:hypothetical protein